MKTVSKKLVRATFTLCLGLTACQPASEGGGGGIEPQLMADALHAVMESDRTVYTRNVVNRLTKEQQVIKDQKEEQVLLE